MKRLVKKFILPFATLLAIFCSILPYAPTVHADDSPGPYSIEWYGYFDFRGESVYGYTSEYVFGGSYGTVRTNLGDGWHIRCVTLYSSLGVDWIECYDADDGDYYGWVDYDFIDITQKNGDAVLQISRDYLEDIAPSYTCNEKGIISCGGSHSNHEGYTEEYIVNGGGYGTIRTNLHDGWHITSSRYCVRGDSKYYECYDLDDGDYYGWIDESILDLTYYDQPATTKATTTATTTTTTTTTMATTTLEETTEATTLAETVAQTIAETTQPPTTAPQVVAQSNTQSNHTSGLLIAVIVIGILLLIGIGVVIVLLLFRKR